MRGRAVVLAVLAVGVALAVAVERAGQQRFGELDLAAGLLIGVAGVVAATRRRGRIAAALLIGAAATWFLSIRTGWTRDLPGDLSRRLAWSHRAFVLTAVLVASGHGDRGFGRRPRFVLRTGVAALAWIAALDEDLARAESWVAWTGLLVVAVLVADVLARRRDRPVWGARYAAAAAAATLAWVGSASVLQHSWQARDRFALYCTGLVTSAVTVAVWARHRIRADAAVAVADGDPADLRFGFARLDGAGFEDLRGEPFAVRAGETATTIELGDGLGRVAVAYRAGGDDARLLERELVDALRLLAAHHTALALTRQQAEQVAASAERIARAEELASLELGDELERVVVSRVERALGLLAGASSEVAATSEVALADVRSEVRALASGFAPGSLDGGLGPALTSLVSSTRLPTRIRVDDSLDAVVGDHARVAYFAAAECLTNAVRHARASWIGLVAGVVDGELTLSVTDDGAGGASPRPGSGLDGLGRRVHDTGGRFEIADRSGGGTVVRVRLPLGSHAATG
jgi:signal transduction histidine kinase